MRVVQVLVSRAGFAETLGAMRDWLDRNNRPLVRFETTSDGESRWLTPHSSVARTQKTPGVVAVYVVTGGGTSGCRVSPVAPENHL